MNMFRKLALTGLIGMVGLTAAGLPAGATLSGHLDSRCQPAATGNIPTVAAFRHLSGQGYWAHTEMGCNVGFYEVITVQKTVNGVTSSRATDSHAELLGQYLRRSQRCSVHAATGGLVSGRGQCLPHLRRQLARVLLQRVVPGARCVNRKPQPSNTRGTGLRCPVPPRPLSHYQAIVLAVDGREIRVEVARLSSKDVRLAITAPTTLRSGARKQSAASRVRAHPRP